MQTINAPIRPPQKAPILQEPSLKQAPQLESFPLVEVLTNLELDPNELRKQPRHEQCG